MISSFICCRADEVKSLDLRSSPALIFSNISVGTGSVLSRCRPEWYDVALRMMRWLNRASSCKRFKTNCDDECTPVVF